MAHGVKLGATAVTPLDWANPESLQTEITIDVVIPAFNEGSCIEGVLRDVIAAREPEWLQVHNVSVISDASTDQTDEVVQQLASMDPRIRLIRKRQRKGKQHSINLAFSSTGGDVVVFIDADVRFADQHSLTKMLCHFRDRETALVQGGLMRVYPGFTLNPAKLASYFDWILVDKVRKRKAMSWWSIDGRVMALSRDFCRELTLPCSLADDQFIFYSCIQQGRKFVWADDAIFYYGPPQSMADFSHQWSRYFFYTEKSRQHFGAEFIDKDMSFPRLGRMIISCFIRHPLCGLAWIGGYATSRVEFMRRVNFHRYERGFFWTKSSPLANLDRG